MATTAATKPRRRRPNLDRATILDAVLRLAAEPGFEPVTVRRLGAELGADPTAIYRHFPDKDALVRAAIDVLLERVNAQLRPGAPWDETVRTAAVLTLEQAVSHPAVGAEMARFSTGGVHELISVERTLDCFRAAGLDDDGTVRYYAMFSGYVLSFCAAEAASLLAAEPGDTSAEHWVPDYSRVDPTAYPNVARYQRRLDALSDRDVYLTGVDLIIESAAAESERHGRVQP